MLRRRSTEPQTSLNKRWLWAVLALVLVCCIYLLVRKTTAPSTERFSAVREPGAGLPQAGGTSGPASAGRAVYTPIPGFAAQSALPAQAGADWSPAAAESVLQMAIDPKRQGARCSIIRGRITDESGIAIPDASVQLYAAMNPRTFLPEIPLALVPSDQTGSYELRLDRPMRAWIAVNKVGYAHVQQRVAAEMDGILIRNFRLVRASASIWGKVSNMDGVGVGNAEVFLSFPMLMTRLEPMVETAPVLCLTDAAGIFQVDNLAPGQMTLSASARGYLTKGDSFALGPGERRRVELRLTKGKLIFFLVKNRAGRPIQGASARVEGISARFEADENGRVELTLPPRLDRIQCTLSATGYRVREVEMNPDLPPSSVVLEEGESLHGEVLSEEGGPVPGATLIFSGSGRNQGAFEGNATTDENGRFSTVVSHPPVTRVAVTRTGYVTGAFSFEPPGPASPIRLRLRRGECGIYGRVFAPDGKPPADFRVVLRCVSPGLSGWSDSRSFAETGGLFSILDLPAGVFDAEIRSWDPGLQKFLRWRTSGLELRKGFLYGELVARLMLPEPAAKQPSP